MNHVVYIEKDGEPDQKATFDGLHEASEWGRAQAFGTVTATLQMDVGDYTLTFHYEHCKLKSVSAESEWKNRAGKLHALLDAAHQLDDGHVCDVNGCETAEALTDIGKRFD